MFTWSVLATLCLRLFLARKAITPAITPPTTTTLMTAPAMAAVESDSSSTSCACGFNCSRTPGLDDTDAEELGDDDVVLVDVLVGDGAAAEALAAAVTEGVSDGAVVVVVEGDADIDAEAEALGACCEPGSDDADGTVKLSARDHIGQTVFTCSSFSVQ